MFLQTAAFEFRYQIKGPIFRATALLFFLLPFAGMTIDSIALGGGSGILMNSTDALVSAHFFMSLAFMFVSAAFVANVIVRDDETRFGQLIRSTRISKADYLLGRFVAAFAVGALVMAMVPLGSWLGSLMPTANEVLLGPQRLEAYVYAFGLFGLPNALILSAILFALATLTRSITATYVGVIAIIALYVTSQAVLGGMLHQPGLQALADPFGWFAYKAATRYATTAQLNAGLAPVTDLLLGARLLWTALALALLGFTYALYRFSDPRASARQRRKWRLQTAAEVAPPAPAPKLSRLPDPHFTIPGLRAQAAARAAMEARHIFHSPAFLILLLIVLAQTFLGLWFNEGQFGQQTYPTAAALIPQIHENFQLLLAVIAILYAGDVVWRERDRRIHEIIDATPLPNWTLLLPKILGLVLVLIAVLLVGMAVGLSVQWLRGGAPIELDKYLLWYLLPASVDAGLIAVLAVFVQALSPNKYAGWAVMALYLMALLFGGKIGLEHDLFVYGSIPAVPVTDLNGLGIYWKAAWWFRLFWAALAALLLVTMHLLWPRGAETRLMPQLRRVPERLKGRAGVAAAAAAAVSIMSGTWIVYNTTILNTYITGAEQEHALAEFEKRFVRYSDLPQPTVRHVELNVALYPKDMRAEVRGRYRLVNETGSPIRQIHIRMLDGRTNILGIDLPGARLERADEASGYRIYRLKEPMQPGEARSLGFQTRRQQIGFRTSGADERLVPNGTDLSNLYLAPRIGMTREYLLEDPTKRRKYGLPHAPSMPRLEDISATGRNGGNQSWTTADITISTSADQTPIAPGKKVSEHIEDGRRGVRFVSDTPILDFFSIQSGRYAVKTLNHKGVELAIYYHPQHDWNVDRLLSAMRASLDYYDDAFGPYQFDRARIVETPSYREGGQSFANTIPFSETAAFTVDLRDPAAIDVPTFGTAHELAHQWWAHQVVGAEMQGSLLLSETLAQYSALMVMEKIYGEQKVRRFLGYQLDRYLSRRKAFSSEELPLIRVESQAHVAYGKGALVMYLLQKRLGEDAVNRALRRFVDQFRFRGPPYARSVDLIDLLRDEARTPEQQALITDLFERITLYDLSVDAPTAVRRADGRWNVTVPVEAYKYYSGPDGHESEAPLSEPIEIGLFTSDPDDAAFKQSDVLMMRVQPIRSGRQSLRFVSDRRPTHAGVDPYSFYIDRKPADNVGAVGSSDH